jgi:hypothetical protein
VFFILGVKSVKRFRYRTIFLRPQKEDYGALEEGRTPLCLNAALGGRWFPSLEGINDCAANDLTGTKLAIITARSA